ncbi:MAG: hypothetical protein M1835_000165 [Candelina submexicana]|nr:MAG: hypothetical protein M1835_002887 [Candelina submexicana]KAI9791669.1 MAG: hypothetical protein M1835_000165 [Candelina submexicana]
MHHISRILSHSRREPATSSGFTEAADRTPGPNNTILSILQLLVQARAGGIRSDLIKALEDRFHELLEVEEEEELQILAELEDRLQSQRQELLEMQQEAPLLDFEEEQLKDRIEKIAWIDSERWRLATESEDTQRYDRFLERHPDPGVSSDLKLAFDRPPSYQSAVEFPSPPPYASNCDLRSPLPPITQAETRNNNLRDALHRTPQAVSNSCETYMRGRIARERQLWALARMNAGAPRLIAQAARNPRQITRTEANRQQEDLAQSGYM